VPYSRGKGGHRQWMALSGRRYEKLPYFTISGRCTIASILEPLPSSPTPTKIARKTFFLSSLLPVREPENYNKNRQKKNVFCFVSEKEEKSSVVKIF
jgi:hypothetical protein